MKRDVKVTIESEKWEPREANADLVLVLGVNKDGTATGGAFKIKEFTKQEAFFGIAVMLANILEQLFNDKRDPEAFSRICEGAIKDHFAGWEPEEEAEDEEKGN